MPEHKPRSLVAALHKKMSRSFFGCGSLGFILAGRIAAGST
jgi:hypothetical protein